MPRSSHKQVLLHLLDAAVLRLRLRWRSLITYAMIQNTLGLLLQQQEPFTGDDWGALMTAPTYTLIAGRLALIRSLQRLRQRISERRYSVERRQWRGLREDRPIVMWRLRNQNDEWFRQTVRMDRDAFDLVLGRIQDNPVFHNQSRNQQWPVEWQLIVGLCRLGHDGNGNAVRMMAMIFSLSEGALILWTRRVIVALLALQQEFIRWPDEEGRNRIKTRIGEKSAFGHCIGFADGTLMPLVIKPGLRDVGVYYSRKSLSLNSLFVADDECRITFMDVGWPGSTHDVRVYRSTDLHLRPRLYFEPEQYLLADSGYQGTSAEWVVPAYKRNIATEIPWEDRQRFNKELSAMRVKVEHTFGMMKMRWQSLRGLRALILPEPETTFEQLVYWIRACAVLHNMLLEEPDDTFWNDYDMNALRAEWEAQEEATRLRLEQEEREAEERRLANAARGRGGRRGRGRGVNPTPDSGQRKRLQQHFAHSDYAFPYGHA